MKVGVREINKRVQWNDNYNCCSGVLNRLHASDIYNKSRGKGKEKIYEQKNPVGNRNRSNTKLTSNRLHSTHVIPLLSNS